MEDLGNNLFLDDLFDMGTSFSHSAQSIQSHKNPVSGLQYAKLMPDLSPIFIEEKKELFKLIENSINAQKQSFLRNCGSVKSNIDQQFQNIVTLLRKRQTALKNELFHEAQQKIAAWDRQLSICQTILQWLGEIDVNNTKAHLQGISNLLNTSLAINFQFIDSGDIEFDIGEMTISTNTMSFLKPFVNLGKIAYNRELKLIAPKFIVGGNGDKNELFCRPWGVCTDSNGYIFICDRSNNRIQIFNELGEFVLQFGKEGTEPGEFNRPAGIAINKNNEIIVSDKDNHRIQIFTYGGRLISYFGREGSGIGEFSYPWDVAVNSKCEIAVSDSKNHRIQLFNNFGIFIDFFDWRKMVNNRLRSWLKLFDSPRGLAFRPDDSLLVTDFNNHRIIIISHNFNEYRIFGSAGGEPGKFFRPQGIACDEYGRFAVSDSKNYRVQVFDACNRLVKTFGCKGSSPGQFDCPQGISFHPNKSLVVVDFNNKRFQVF